MRVEVEHLLVCPICRGALSWSEEAHCDGCGTSYAVRDDIAVLLPPRAAADPWEASGSGLERALRASPELERRLLDPDPNELNPADRMFRALVLDERGDVLGADELAASAERELYTHGYRACRERQLDALVQALRRAAGPIVDLASGRCTLVERLARDLPAHVVATDLSPTVLQRGRARLRALGLGDHVSFVCFDARRTPFPDGAIAAMTTNLGLGNVEDPGGLLAELRRVVSGELLALCAFFPADDAVNTEVARAAGLAELLHLEATLGAFRLAGWTVETLAACRSKARPTPPGVVLEGARVDGLPVADTVLDWRLLRAA